MIEKILHHVIQRNLYCVLLWDCLFSRNIKINITMDEEGWRQIYKNDSETQIIQK